MQMKFWQEIDHSHRLFAQQRLSQSISTNFSKISTKTIEEAQIIQMPLWRTPVMWLGLRRRVFIENVYLQSFHDPIRDSNSRNEPRSWVQTPVLTPQSTTWFAFKQIWRPILTRVKKAIMLQVRSQQPMFRIDASQKWQHRWEESLEEKKKIAQFQPCLRLRVHPVIE
jgi:hypothetical protein